MAKIIKNIEVKQALALAIVAFRLNDNQILRFGVTDKVDNKTLVINHLIGKTLLDLTDKDLSLAEQIIEYFPKKIMMDTLTGKTVSSFCSSIHDILSKEIINSRDLGVLVWAPKVYVDMAAKDSASESLVQIGCYSRWIGKEKDLVTIEFTPAYQSYNRYYGIWYNIGHDNKGNLVSFVNKNSVEKSCIIVGRVKSCDTESNLAGLKITRLNYAKIKNNNK